MQISNVIGFNYFSIPQKASHLPGDGNKQPQADQLATPPLTQKVRSALAQENPTLTHQDSLREQPEEPGRGRAQEIHQTHVNRLQHEPRAQRQPQRISVTARHLGGDESREQRWVIE